MNTIGVSYNEEVSRGNQATSTFGMMDVGGKCEPVGQQREIDRLICQLRERVDYCHNVSVRIKDKFDPMCCPEPTSKQGVEPIPDTVTLMGNLLMNISEQVKWSTINLEGILERIQI